MANNNLFGSFVIPSLPDLKSNCEEELQKLIKEIDLEFKCRTKNLQEQLLESRSLCQTKEKDIVLLTSKLKNKSEDDKNLKQKVEELKKELCLLRKENSTLKIRIESCAKYEAELEKYKENLLSEKRKNEKIQKRLTGVISENRKLRTFLTTLQQDKNVDEDKNKNASFVNELITIETEKYLQEEAAVCNEFQYQIDRQIDDLKKMLNEKCS